eukprot:CAMPEP_0179280448 /NCGR_PEP_ID=MMETSP0797-20121207/36635_1 /TAXON_ID=47934 /ORGANISM="Dinophysis acuminata, Strain DAEP01" /LENGTH=244 /DNA_ID=CAMNT_0020989109 /DNA_START=20 /DNA_END=752 /DNA_ORIENTATION=+
MMDYPSGDEENEGGNPLTRRLHVRLRGARCAGAHTLPKPASTVPQPCCEKAGAACKASHRRNYMFKSSTAAVVSRPAHCWQQLYRPRLQSVELVDGLHRLDYLHRRGVRDLPSEQQLVENAVDLVEVEHQVELADVAEVAVEHLHEEVDELEGAQLVVVHVDAEGEEHAGVAPVDDLVLPVLEEVRVLRVAADHRAVDLGFDLELLAGVEGHVPLGQARLALAVLQEDEADHRRAGAHAAPCPP